MIDKLIRDTANLLVYGGVFIGLCAACITALTFEMAGRALENLSYCILIGTATAALYSVHRVISLTKTAHSNIPQRFLIIRKYLFHIRVYAVLWMLISAWLFMTMFTISFFLWLLPGGIIAFTYVVPFLSGGRRIRDLGWGKILMIGWSWAWLTAFIPLYFFGKASFQAAIMHGLERMLFIILLTIPFEIRDLHLDRSAGLLTIPEKLGVKKTKKIALVLCFFIALLGFILSFHYFNPSYGIAVTITSLLLIPLIKYSYSTDDDFYFAGLIDGMMIVMLWLYMGSSLIV